MLHRVFVYGSLMSGLGNHHLLGSARFKGLRNQPRHLGRCRTARRWTMIDLGAFPAVLEGPDGPGRVAGELYAVEADTLADLDRLEGHPDFYRRIRVTILGETIPAWMYVLPPGRARDADEVPSGDWRAHLARRAGEASSKTV